MPAHFSSQDNSTNTNIQLECRAVSVSISLETERQKNHCKYSRGVAVPVLLLSLNMLSLWRVATSFPFTYSTLK